MGGKDEGDGRRREKREIVEYKEVNEKRKNE